MADELFISISNPYKDINQSSFGGDFFNNLSFSPTVKELNEIIGGHQEIHQLTSTSSNGQETEEPLFGTHIREAAKTVKKLFSSR
jgi:hypothetical protein